MSRVTVSVRDVHVSYESLADRGRIRRSKTIVPALKGVDFELHEGEALGLIGRNGSGKSTLMQVIAGLLPRSKGEVAVAAQPQLLGVAAALNARLSGRANIELGCLALGINPRNATQVHARIEEFSELGAALDRPVISYSAGMHQRLAFSIAVTVRPEILLVDEALAVGDQAFKEKCIAELQSVKEDAGTVILATHVMGEILASCTRAIWLEDGTIRQAGDPQDVVKAYLQTNT